MKLPPPLNYKLLATAAEYYTKHGYHYIETPWVVQPYPLEITQPKNHPAPETNIVSSGEQSFLQLILDGKLKPGRYQTITPCYRPHDNEPYNPYHYTQFIKLELISTIDDEQEYRKMWETALTFATQQGLHAHQVNRPDEPRKHCTTHESCDIDAKTATGEWLEIGSYGLRHSHRIGHWVYGTGLALPRFSTAQFDGFWWCDNCEDTKSPQQVNHDTTCTKCRQPVTWIATPEQAQELGFD